MSAGALETLYCVDGSSGALQWSYPLQGYIFAPPSIGLNGTIVVGAVAGDYQTSTFGRVFALQAVPVNNTNPAASESVRGSGVAAL